MNTLYHNDSSIKNNSSSEYICIILTSFLLILLFFIPYLISSSIIYSGDFGSSDLLELNIPRHILAVQTLRQGALPLWESKLSNGLPLLAEGQTAVFNPFSIIPFILFSPSPATNICLLITLFIAFSGAYCLIRSFGLHPLASLIGAVSFAFGGVFIFRLRNLNTIHAIAYLPFILFLLRNYADALRNRRSVKRHLAGLGTVMVLQILTGHPHMTYLSWIAAAVFIISSLWGESNCFAAADPADESAEEPTQTQRSNLRIIFKACWQLAAVGIISALLCSIQLLPTFELSQSASRSQPYNWESLMESPFTVKDLLHLVYPYCYGNPALGTYERTNTSQGIFWEVSAYIGLAPLGLALLTLGDLRQRRTAWLWALTVFYFLASLGPQGYVYGIFWKFCPGFNLFRCPSRFLFAFSLMLAILSAFGCQRLIDTLDRYVSSLKAKAIIAALLIFTLADLAYINHQYHTPLPSSWAKAPDTISFIKQADSKVYTPTYCFSWQEMIGSQGWRNVPQAVMAHRDLLSQDLSAVWGVYQHSDSNVLDGGLAVNAYRQLQMYQLNQLLSSFDSKGTIAVNHELLSSLRRQGVTHILTYHKIRNAAEFPVLDTEKSYLNPQYPQRLLYIYAFKKPLGRVYFTESLSSEPSAYIKQMQTMFNIENNGSLYESGTADTEIHGSASVAAEHANSLTVECICEQPGSLIITNIYYPGWRAFIDDGREVPIRRVNHAYQAVDIPAGHHTVVLKYSPQSFARGWKISLTTLLCLIIGAALHFALKYRSERQ